MDTQTQTQISEMLVDYVPPIDHMTIGEEDES